MTTRTRRWRGSVTQKVVAAWYAERIWPGAEPCPPSNTGSDIRHVPVDIEVKGRKGFAPLEAVRQLKARQPGPFGPGWVVMRMDGQGEKSAADYLVVMTLADHTQYVKELAHLRDLARATLEKPDVPAREEAER